MRHFFPLLESFSKMPKLSDYEAIAQDYAIRASTTMNTSLHIAFLYGRGGAMIAMSTNGIGSRSRGAGYSRYTIHAERAVLKMVGDFSLLKGATLVVVRVSKKGELMSSMPCHECKCHLTKAIDKYGLRRVYYSAPANAPPTLTSDPPVRSPASSSPESSRPGSPTLSHSTHSSHSSHSSHSTSSNHGRHCSHGSYDRRVSSIGSGATDSTSS